jgi:riboflavin synthase
MWEVEICSMFTGIIETTGIVSEVIREGNNRSFWIRSTLSAGFRADQSVSHDGVCLTVEEVSDQQHRVTAIGETLKKTNLGGWAPGRLVNIERCLPLNGRLDGHFVQGHVDTVGKCTAVIENEGSREYTIDFPREFAELIIEKGSICLNGISLTAFNVSNHQFTVAIIPYTSSHTNIRYLEPGHLVNLEFDLLGKYINRKISLTAV